MNNMNANMAGFNAGGAALGNIPMVNNVPNGAMRQPEEQVEDTPNYEAKLNALIYHYLCTKGQYDSARAVKNSHMVFDPPLTGGDVNGVDNSMQNDSKEGIDKNRPDDLPDIEGTMNDGQGGSFLLGWFCLFWDIYFAQRKLPKASQNAMQYVQHTTVSRLHYRYGATKLIPHYRTKQGYVRNSNNECFQECPWIRCSRICNI